MIEVEINETKFDQLQSDLIRTLLLSIKQNLSEIDILKGSDLEDISENIAFSICNILDNTQAINKEGNGIHLCFNKLNNEDVIITVEGGGWSHEYVFGSFLDMNEEDK